MGLGRILSISISVCSNRSYCETAGLSNGLLHCIQKHSGICEIIRVSTLKQAALCWLKLSLVELSYSSVMKQSISLTLGVYWEKRLTSAQRRFTRSCETLARVRKLSRNTPALQVNIAAEGGQQVNLSK